MVVGGRGIVHRVDVFAEIGFGLRIAFEEDEDVIEAEVVGDGAAVVLCDRSGWSGVAGEGDEFGFVDGFGNLRVKGLGAERRGHGRSGERERGDKDGATADARPPEGGRFL